MNASYLYFSYEARVVLLEDSIYDIGIGHFWDEKAGFSEDLSSYGFVISTFGVQKDKKDSGGMYLFNICREELRWREDRSLASCTTGGFATMELSSCKDFDQLKI